MKATVMRVTPAIAEAWLKKNHPDNRAISSNRVSVFVDDMNANAWRLTHQGICFGENDDLIDGQHRLAAVVKSGKTVEMLVVRDSAISLHSPIDRGRGRSLSMVTGKAPWQLAILTSLKRLQSCANNNLAMSIEGARATEKQNRATLEVLFAIPGFSQLRGSVAGAIAYTYPISSRKVLTYTKDLIRGSMLPDGHPAIAHRRWMDKKRGQNTWNHAMVTLNCLRHALSDMPLNFIHVTDQGYRAVTTKRRTLRIPHTPASALVESLTFRPK